MVRQRVFLDFAINNIKAGRVVFELFNDVVPKTTENFRALCTGEKGLSPISQLPLSYKNSTIHRSIVGFMVQGGDFTKFNGKGGESIYGAPFEDEDLTRTIDQEGLLVMANRGPNTNGSQFFVSLRACPHLDGKHVTFGRVLAGYDVIVKISELPVDPKDRPLEPVTIVHCGELELKNPTAKTSAPTVPSRELSREATSDEPKKRRRRDEDMEDSDSDTPDDTRHHRSQKDDGDDRSGGELNKERDPDPKRDSRRERPSKSKSHKKKHRSSRRDRSRSRSVPKGDAMDDTHKLPHEETEAELDARLEREENERLQLEKERKLEALRKAAPAETAGLNLKGRGRMVYQDPEGGRKMHGW